MDKLKMQSATDARFKVLAAVRAALSRGNDDDALAIITDAPAAVQIDAHLLRFKYFKTARRLQEALQVITLAHSLSLEVSGPPDIFTGLADIYLLLKEVEKASSAVDEGLLQHPGSIDVLLRKVAVLAARKELGAAEAVLREVFTSSSYSSGLDSQLANAVKAIQGAAPQRAFALAGEICGHHPTSGALARLFGDLAFKVKQFDVALTEFDRALTLLMPGGLRDAVLAGRERVFRAIAAKTAEKDQRALALANVNARPFLVCAITNVYNEKFNLPIWLEHYGSHVGIKNCVILDNGTDDGSTDNLRGAGLVPMPRGPVFNERHRMKIVTDLANNLLNYYDAVLYSDCDEILVPDPAKYASIHEYCASMTLPVVHAIGLNVRQDITREAPIRTNIPILAQRSLVQFVSAMCKPLITRRPISWGGGFHSCDNPPNFDDIYLFHLRHVDLGQALERLSITRNISFAREGGGKHHRREDVDLATAMYSKTHTMPVSEDFDFGEILDIHKAGTELSFSGRYAVKRAANAKHLFRIPERFRYSF